MPNSNALTRHYLRKNHFRRNELWAAEQAIFRIFNFGITRRWATRSSSPLTSIGLDLESIDHRPGTDRTEYFAEVKQAASVMLRQAEALADMRHNDPVFETHSNKIAGNSFERVRTRLSKLLEATNSMVGRPYPTHRRMCRPQPSR